MKIYAPSLHAQMFYLLMFFPHSFSPFSPSPSSPSPPPPPLSPQPSSPFPLLLLLLYLFIYLLLFRLSPVEEEDGALAGDGDVAAALDQALVAVVLGRQRGGKVLKQRLGLGRHLARVDWRPVRPRALVAA